MNELPLESLFAKTQCSVWKIGTFACAMTSRRLRCEGSSALARSQSCDASRSNVGASLSTPRSKYAAAAFELANTLRAQHAKECARHSAELAKVKDVAKKALDAVKSREADAEQRAHRLHEEVMALKVAVAEARDSLAAAEGNVLDAKSQRASAVRVVGLVGVFSAILVLNVKRK